MTTPAPPDNTEVTDLALDYTEVARRLRLPEPVSDTQQFILETAIADAQADVEGYLGRPIVPMQYVDTHRYPYPDGWRLSQPKVAQVLSATPEEDAAGNLTGYYTVTYLAGLDARNDRTYAPIKRYLVAAVLNDWNVVRLWQEAIGNDAMRREQSVSVEGQSVTYQYLTPTGVDVSVQGARYNAARNAAGTGTPGALNLDTLDRWRLRGRRVFQRSTLRYDEGTGAWYRDAWGDYTGPGW